MEPLGPHEVMEIHELLNFKTICTMKSKAMDGLVTDKDLKSVMEQDLQQSLRATQELQRLLERVEME